MQTHRIGIRKLHHVLLYAPKSLGVVQDKFSHILKANKRLISLHSFIMRYVDTKSDVLAVQIKGAKLYPKNKFSNWG